MCFDTTASNSGIINGVCAKLEEQIERRLYSFACRHHILELIVAATYDDFFGVSNGPKIPLFERFSNFWGSIDRSNYSSGLEDPELAAFLTEIKEETICFVHKQLKSYQPREDYLQLLNLVLILMGEQTQQVFLFLSGT